MLILSKISEISENVEYLFEEMWRLVRSSGDVSARLNATRVQLTEKTQLSEVRRQLINEHRQSPCLVWH